MEDWTWVDSRWSRPHWVWRIQWGDPLSLQLDQAGPRLLPTHKLSAHHNPDHNHCIEDGQDFCVNQSIQFDTLIISSLRILSSSFWLNLPKLLSKLPWCPSQSDHRWPCQSRYTQTAGGYALSQRLDVNYFYKVVLQCKRKWKYYSGFGCLGWTEGSWHISSCI